MLPRDTLEFSAALLLGATLAALAAMRAARGTLFRRAS